MVTQHSIVQRALSGSHCVLEVDIYHHSQKSLCVCVCLSVCPVDHSLCGLDAPWSFGRPPVRRQGVGSSSRRLREGLHVQASGPSHSVSSGRIRRGGNVVETFGPRAHVSSAATCCQTSRQKGCATLCRGDKCPGLSARCGALPGSGSMFSLFCPEFSVAFSGKFGPIGAALVLEAEPPESCPSLPPCTRVPHSPLSTVLRFEMLTV